MKGYKELYRWITSNRKLMLLAASCIIYLLMLLRFYLCGYYAADEGLYCYLASSGYKSIAGYSSLFILLSGLISAMPQFYHVCCLMMLTLSIFNIGYFYIKTYSTESGGGVVNDLIVFGTLFSSSIWYYLYGKLYYDYPFVVFSYSLALVIYGRMINLYRCGKGYRPLWILLCLLMGFTLSWKLYYIFTVAGFGLLILINGESRYLVWEVLRRPLNIVRTLLAVVTGYLAGNFNLIFSPKETISGILALGENYRFDFGSFLIGKSGVIWDHVNNLPFHFSVFNIVGACLILFVIPLFIKKYLYFGLSVFMTFCLYLFITYFSPGYAWHGFSFGIFIITFVIFLCAEQKVNTKAFRYIAVISILIQFVTCYGFYIPKQVHWYNKTNQAVHILEEHSSEIASEIERMKEKIGSELFSVDVAVKRNQFVASNAFQLHYPEKENPYCFATNYECLDVLAANALMNWRSLWASSNYRTDYSNCDYVFYIIPDCFMELADVADIYKYSSFEQEDRYLGDGYTIFLYHRPELPG